MGVENLPLIPQENMQSLSQKNVEEKEEMITQCCVCHRVKVSNRWKLRPIKPNDKITSTYCPKCLSEEDSKMRDRIAYEEQLQTD